MDSGQNSQYTSFFNIFLIKSAISADLSKSQKNHLESKLWLHGACPDAVNDPSVSCGHWKHDLYWDLLKGKVTVVDDPLKADPDSAHSQQVLDVSNDVLEFLIPLFFGVGIFYRFYFHTVIIMRYSHLNTLHSYSVD